MARHMFVTFLIVSGIYISLLFAIGHPFVAEAMPAETATTQAIEQEIKVAETQSKQPEQLQQSDVKPEPAPQSIEKTDVKVTKKMLFKGPTIVGVQAKVDLNNAEQEVQQVWQRLQNNKILQSNVAWNKGNIKVYAYYSGFDANFSTATLAIGYDQEDLRLNSDIEAVTLPTGSFNKFAINAATGSPSEKAWAQAYIYKNLIERHTLNRHGEMVTSEAIVVEH